MKTLLKVILLGLVLVLSLGEAFGQYVWTKDARNPVFSGVNGTWSSNVFYPCVLFNRDSARFEMWFNAIPGPTSDPTWHPYSIGFAVSKDGITWSMYPSPVLTPDAGKWDSFTTEQPEVLRENGQYKMWYSSYNNDLPSKPGYFGYATSPDGIHWTKYSGNPIFGPGTAAWEAAGPSNCKVIPKQGGYRMWFNGYSLSLTTTKIGYAESSDGITWIRDTVHNPILDVGSTGQWDDASIGPGSVVSIGDSVYMWYTANKAGVDGGQTGLAVSRDGITNWRKYSANPVLAPGAPGAWDNERTNAETVLRIGDTLHMWYDGWRTPYTSYQYRIGHATAPVVVDPHGAVNDEKGNIPGAFLLAQNYPNPFNPSTIIKFELPTASHVTLSVHDILGREVSVLVNEKRNAGVYEVKFDGSSLTSGVYFSRLQAGNFVETKKMLIVK